MSIAGLVVVVMAVLGTRYGFHRDELYYLAGGRRLEWGYVDHPPATPLLARVLDQLTGGSLWALRTTAAVGLGVIVVLGALIARELGADRRAQVLTAGIVVALPLFRATHLLFGTTGLDQLIWALALWLAVRMMRCDDPRLWVPLGAVVGVGLEVKWTVLVLAAGLVAGVLLSGRRDLTRPAWMATGGALALLLWMPNLLWNARHGWAGMEFMLGVGGDDPIGGRLEFVAGQFLITGVIGVAIWGPGWRRLLRRDGTGSEFRAMGLTAIVVFALLFLAGGKQYYPIPLYLPLLAAGIMALQERPHGTSRAVVVGAVAFVLTLPLSLAVLPSDSVDLVRPVNKELSEMIGWEELASQVESAFSALPPEQRETTAVLTGNYGQAGAIEQFAPDLPVYSGHNSFWWWKRPPSDTSTLLLVGYGPEAASEICPSAVQVGAVDNGLEVDNDEAGAPITICELSEPPGTWWDDARHYD